MPTRSENYIQLFEGFRLGSLGAGKKPASYEEPKTPKLPTEIHILREDDAPIQVFGQLRHRPSLYWQDLDGYGYHFGLDYRPEDTSFLFSISCGEVILSTKGIRTSWLAWSACVILIMIK